MKGFYAGLKPDLVRLLPSNTIVFIVYEYMKRKIKVWKCKNARNKVKILFSKFLIVIDKFIYL